MILATPPLITPVPSLTIQDNQILHTSALQPIPALLQLLTFLHMHAPCYFCLTYSYSLSSLCYFPTWYSCLSSLHCYFTPFYTRLFCCVPLCYCCILCYSSIPLFLSSSYFCPPCCSSPPRYIIIINVICAVPFLCALFPAVLEY